MNYEKLSKETIDHLYSGYSSLKKVKLDDEIRVLVELLVSEINGCSYCIKVHSDEAKELQIDREKTENLTNYETSSIFTDGEKEVLRFAESLTRMRGNKRVNETNLSKFFDEKDIADITICVSLMNALNRIAISMRNGS